MIRINKYLSMCGFASRRKADELIEKGRVAVNDEVIESVGLVIDEKNDSVKVDGKVVRPVPRNTYLVLNKPKNVVTTMKDPFRRKTVSHLVRKAPARVYPVGRLDIDTDGVLLMTDDGELAFRLAHPKYQIEKVYSAIVKGAVTAEDIDKIESGVELPDGHIAKATADLISSNPKNSKIILTLCEGRKREVKHIMKAVDHPVISLRRVQFAGIRLGSLKPGRWRFLKPPEIHNLKKIVGLK